VTHGDDEFQAASLHSKTMPQTKEKEVVDKMVISSKLKFSSLQKAVKKL
jgi:hypothetical protein